MYFLLDQNSEYDVYTPHCRRRDDVPSPPRILGTSDEFHGFYDYPFTPVVGTAPLPIRPADTPPVESFTKQIAIPG